MLNAIDRSFIHRLAKNGPVMSAARRSSVLAAWRVDAAPPEELCWPPEEPMAWQVELTPEWTEQRCAPGQGAISALSLRLFVVEQYVGWAPAGGRKERIALDEAMAPGARAVGTVHLKLAKVDHGLVVEPAKPEQIKAALVYWANCIEFFDVSADTKASWVVKGTAELARNIALILRELTVGYVFRGGMQRAGALVFQAATPVLHEECPVNGLGVPIPLQLGQSSVWTLRNDYGQMVDVALTATDADRILDSVRAQRRVFDGQVDPAPIPIRVSGRKPLKVYTVNADGIATRTR